MSDKECSVAYVEAQRNILLQANNIGRDLKDADKMGKEYFAFYNIHGDTILDWVEEKVRELIINAAKQYISVVGITHDLTDKHVFKVSSVDTSIIYVHKKRLKRFLKKSVQRNLNKF